MAIILLQNGPIDIKDYADILNAVHGTLHFSEINRLFGLLFHGSQEFYSSSSETVYEELSKLSERLAQGEEFSDYELMNLRDMDRLMRSSIKFADPYIYYKKAKGLEGLFQKAEEFGSKNNAHKIMVEEGEKVLRQELPELADILAGKEGTVLHEAQKLWQAKANLWHTHRVPGLKYVETNLAIEEQEDLNDDKIKLASAIISEMPEFNDRKNTIINLTTGKFRGFTPKNKKDRLFYDKFLKVRDKCLREMEGFSEGFNKLRQELIDNERIVGEQARELHGQVIGLLKDKSPVSDEEAEEWASKNVYISSKVASALKSIGYPEEELRRDIAEYYQLCGGKLGPVEITGTGRGKRAFARGKYQIEIDNVFDKRCLFHECSHLVECYAGLGLASSQQFIKDRASGNPKRLNELVPNSTYGNGEKAYPDNFINPYVGKIYDNASEVLSMGMQMFASPDTLLYFMRNDPEHFKLTISQCMDSNEVLRDKLKQEYERASEIMAEANKKIDLKAAWEKSLKDAMPKNFKEALLLPQGVDGCRLDVQKGSRSGYLYINDSAGRQKYRDFGKIGNLLTLAYLYLASKNSLIPESGYGSGDDVEIDQINSDLFSGKLPAWFDPDAGLPKYSLPQEALKAVKNQEDNARLHAKFLKALDDCLKDSAVGSLFNKGVEGYSIMGGMGRPRDLYSKAMQKLGNSGYVGKFETDACLRLTALLILNQRKLLPETFENEKQAIRECRKYVETQTVPAWFVEGMTLPEIR